MQLSELTHVLPELWLLAMSILILLVDLFVSRGSKTIIYYLTQTALIGILFLTAHLIGTAPKTVFNQMFVVDDIANVLKFSIALVGFFVFLYSRQFVFGSPNYKSEYFVLCLFSIFGMMVLISARSFLTLYLGIELFALPLYALIPIVKKDSIAPEAAMKYFVMGALASGLLLYGISLLYGVTGSFQLQEIASALIHQMQHPHPALLFGLVFVLVGLAFKFGAVPFHLWLPDVYQGAPLSVTLFIGTLPKLAAFGFAIRLLSDTFMPFALYWQPILVVMSVLSLTIGNVVAIAQTNLKRMLAYSTIAHMGFLFLGLLAGPESGFAAALDYVIIYALMALGAFGIMTVLSAQRLEAENIADFRGLGVRNPWLAFLMMIVFFSLAGIPPFAGFYAKLVVLNALVNAGYVWLAVFAVLLTVVGAYYYLRVIRVMFFDAPAGNHPFQPVSALPVAALSFNGLAILALGIFPAPLFNLCLSVLPLSSFN
ncbi:MAG TPA: NADH-quinone oxidoreductase subunit NuoN [Gammaproteobacteria bacterium]|nr:NADH-quinone oxidoreductase subunit NuoN [Gammaproteobacteria bacterium]